MRAFIGLCEVRDPRMHGNSTRENREALPTPDMKESGPVGEGDEPQVQRERWWRVARSCSTCEVPEQRRKAVAGGCGGKATGQENTGQTTASQTQSWGNALSGLHRVREAAKKDKRLQFTTLLHHVSVHVLQNSFYALKREAAPGVDGMTWKEYETDLDKRLEDLHSRVHGGAYLKRTDDSGPWALLPWRTKSFNTRWGQFSIRFTRRTSWGSLMGSDPGAASTMRWMRYGWGS